MASACLGERTVWDFGGKGPAGRRPAAGEAHARHITAVAWQPPSGATVATCGADGTIALWPAPTRGGQILRPAAVAESAVAATTLAWTPGGRALAVGRADGGVELRPLGRRDRPPVSK
jgi:WD40 repeat protein